MSEKSKAIDAAILQIEKQFGKGSIMKLGAEGIQAIDVIPSGSLALDLALGVGGYPRGRVVEIYGQEASGKTASRSTRARRSRRGAAPPRSSTPSQTSASAAT